MKYQQTPGIVCAEVEDQMVLLHPINGKVIILNEPGTCLWHLLKEGLVIEDLLNHFSEIYESSSKAKEDINAFVDELSKKGLLHVEM